MKNTFIILSVFSSLFSGFKASSQTKKPVETSPASQVNVFVGSSGDHGQMSPAASYPFSMLSIGPQTYPNLHMGYEHKAKVFLGFTHNRFEGVGCQGSGGNILIKPFLGDDANASILNKVTEQAGPGFYQVAFSNHISTKIAVYQNAGVESYSFPQGEKGFFIDLSHTLANRFVAEEHELGSNEITGWIDSRTTCNVGTYRVYYCIKFNQPVTFVPGDAHKLIAKVNTDQVQLSVAVSSVDIAHAKTSVKTIGFEQIKMQSSEGWNKVLSRIKVKGNPEREKLFYSMLYRTVQSPYVVSETDGSFRATDGSLQTTKDSIYNGWAIWDNYRTQLPLLSILYPDRYQSITTSLTNLYRFGKKDYATKHEPSNTVRTEHAIVVLLDAYHKGYKVDFAGVLDSLKSDIDKLDFSHPDKALESSYDTWAFSQILTIAGKTELANQYKQKALGYKEYWNKDFKDIRKNDVDRVSARGLYQGTIWQYRWFVPFDIKGLTELIGGEKEYIRQLDQFFDNDYYNHANEPDIQVPFMYNASAQPWKSQAAVHKYAADTVVQYYFNDNSRGIDPFVDFIYQNKPDTYVRTMDDDAGAMSAWFVFAATGVSPACVGWPVYYLNVPLFKQVQFTWPGGKTFNISVPNYVEGRKYIESVTLNGKKLNRNWLTHQEIMNGGTLVITAADKPNEQFGVTDQWVSDIDMK